MVWHMYFFARAGRPHLYAIGEVLVARMSAHCHTWICICVGPSLACVGEQVQEEFDEDKDSAIQLSSGKIGHVKVTPSWMGTVEVKVLAAKSLSKWDQQSYLQGLCSALRVPKSKTAA